MKLILSPARSRHTVTYSATGDVVTAVLNGIEQQFDFSNDADGTYTVEPDTDQLEASTVTRAVRENGQLTVYATHHFGPPPQRQMALGIEGEQEQHESDEAYQMRLDVYEQECQVREVIL